MLFHSLGQFKVKEKKIHVKKKNTYLEQFLTLN